MLKRKDVLKFLPKLSEVKKEAKSKEKLSVKLAAEAKRAREIADGLDGVVMHDNFPVKVAEYSGGVEVRSGCVEVKRSAFVRAVGGKYGVTTYRNDGNDTDGTPLDGEFAKSAAVRVAKDFVAKGIKTVKKNA